MLPTLSHISQTFLRPYLHSIDSFPSTLLQLLPPPPTVFSQHSTFIGQAALPLFLPKTPHLTAVGSQCREARAEAKISSPCRSPSVPADRNQSPPQDSFCSFFFLSMIQVLLLHFSCFPLLQCQKSLQSKTLILFSILLSLLHLFCAYRMGFWWFGLQDRSEAQLII